MIQRLLILVTSLLIGFQSFAQDKILLLSGKYVDIKSYSLNEDYIFYNKMKDTRTKSRMMEKMDVFSIVKADGTEEMIYKADTVNGLSIEQVRNFIRGEQAAARFYNRQAHIGESAIVGVASSILIFYSLPAPMLNAVVLGRFTPKKMQIPDGYDLPYSTTEEYKIGYEKKARNIKIQQSIKWGYIGLGVGLAGLITYFSTGGE